MTQPVKQAPRNRENKSQNGQPAALFHAPSQNWKIIKNEHFSAFFGMGSLNIKVSKFNSKNFDEGQSVIEL